MKTYPVFLILSGQSVLVVGGGEVAERKVEALVESGAVVKVVADKVSERLEQLERSGAITVERRRYNPGEAAGYALTVAATDDRQVNREAAADARGAGRLVNVVDQTELCNFIAPSQIKRGELTIAISTGGLGPALSRRLKERLEASFPERLGALIDLLGDFRPALMEKIADFDQRRKIMTEVVNSKEIDVFLEGDDKPLKELLEKWT